MNMRIQLRVCLLSAAVAMASLPAAAQTTIPVPLTSATTFGAMGTGGAPPQIITGTYLGASGEAVDALQPGSYVEWKVNCLTPGLYHIAITVSQWQDNGCVLSFETRPFSSPDNPYSTRYAAQDTKDYGQTNGTWAFMETGDIEDAQGNQISVPLWSGNNVLRVQNVTGRHESAYTYPPNMTDPHDRDWGTFWGNVHIGRITLTRVDDLPAMGAIVGRVTADRPYGLGVKRAMVLANDPGQSPPEPSWFWKNGYYTYTHDDGTFALNAPAGTVEVAAGRPGSYQIQGSPIITTDLAVGATVTASPLLTTLFQNDGAGNIVASIQACYADTYTGALGLLSVDGQNGHKVGWVDVGDTWSVTVDAPRAGFYKVRSAYTNGGTNGVSKVSNDAGGSVQGSQPAVDWGTLQTVDFPGTLYLRQGPNVITQALQSGNSDYNAIALTEPPVVLGDARRALQIAAGLVAATSADSWMSTVTGSSSNQIGVDDAVRLLQAATGNPL